MYKLRRIISYLNYLFKAKGKYRIHSPFVYNLLTEVIQDRTTCQAFDEIENVRKLLIKQTSVIEVKDFGAVSGNKQFSMYQRRVSDIARHSSVNPKYAQLLYRLARHFNPTNILELGTSLGISTMYLSKACPSAHIFTVEGCENIAKIALENFNRYQCNNIHLSTGPFDKELDIVLNTMQHIDLLFIDGDHRKISTLNYFEKCLPLAGNDSLFIIDDIHWSEGMLEAWKEICTKPEVKVSIDLFFMGLVFFRRESAKQDFLIRF